MSEGDAPLAGFENVDMSQLGLSPTGQPLMPRAEEEPSEPEVLVEPTEEPTESEEAPEVDEPEEPAELADPNALVELPDGTTITLERARQLAAMELAFRTTPDAERRITEALRPSGLDRPVPQGPADSPLPAPVAAQPPPDLDLDDPAVRYMWTQQQEVQAQVQALRDTIATQNRTQEQLQAQQAAVGLQAARNNIVARYGLNPDELAQVEQSAAKYANLQQLIADEGGSIERAAVRAMEGAIALDPQMRNRITQPKETAKDKDRKTKLSALAGTSGSAPRTEPAVPLDNKQKVEAMAADIARAVSGQQV
jgi:hypothetical protein